MMNWVEDVVKAPISDVWEVYEEGGMGSQSHTQGRAQQADMVVQH